MLPTPILVLSLVMVGTAAIVGSISHRRLFGVPAGLASQEPSLDEVPLVASI